MKHEVKSLSDYTEAQTWGRLSGTKLKVLQSVASLLILKWTFLPEKGKKNEKESCEREKRCEKLHEML